MQKEKSINSLNNANYELWDKLQLTPATLFDNTTCKEWKDVAFKMSHSYETRMLIY